ncbi:MAG: hypothetical protein NVS3B21_09870 [Acidimicrobiales bacterium]
MLVDVHDNHRSPGAGADLSDSRTHEPTTHNSDEIHERTVAECSSTGIVDRVASHALKFDPITEARRQWLAHDLAEPLAMVGATSIMRAQQLVSAEIERALGSFGLTFSRWELLMLLSFSRSGSLPITKAGHRLMIHPTGVSKLVDKLEAQGLVRRERDPADRRTTLASIQPAGRELAERAGKAVAAVRFGLDLDDDDLETLVTVLERHRRAGGASAQSE